MSSKLDCQAHLTMESVKSQLALFSELPVATCKGMGGLVGDHHVRVVVWLRSGHQHHYSAGPRWLAYAARLPDP